MNKNILLLVILLFSAHSSPQLNPLGIPLVCFPLLIIVPYIYYENTSKFSNIVFKRIFYLLIVFSCLFVFSIGTSLYIDHLKSIIQTFYGFIAGFSLFVIYEKLSQKKLLKKGIFIFLCLILILSTLERFIPAYRELSFNIAEAIFRENTNYTLATRLSDEYRSIQIAGFIRPIVFSTENSILGKTIFCSAVSLIILMENFNKKLLLSILILLSYFSTGSPACILFFISFLVSEFLKQNSQNNKFNFVSILNILLLVLSLILAYYVFKVRIEDFSSKLNEIDSLSLTFLIGHSSEFVRIILPLISLQKVLSINPIFGLGYGADTYAKKLVYGEFIELDNFVNNNLIYPLVSFGIVGFALIIILILKNKPRFMHIPNYYIPYIFVFFGYSGGFVEPRFWINFFSILSSIYLVNKIKFTKQSLL